VTVGVAVEIRVRKCASNVVVDNHNIGYYEIRLTEKSNRKKIVYYIMYNI
jgi:hypothetical protein